MSEIEVTPDQVRAKTEKAPGDGIQIAGQWREVAQVTGRSSSEHPYVNITLIEPVFGGFNTLTFPLTAILIVDRYDPLSELAELMSCVFNESSADKPTAMRIALQAAEDEGWSFTPGEVTP